MQCVAADTNFMVFLRRCYSLDVCFCCCVAAYGACEAIAGAVSRLSAATGTRSLISEEDTSALAEARSVALELLLGAMSNLAPYRTEDLLQVRAPRPRRTFICYKH
jgi:hypothetical protein